MQKINGINRNTKSQILLLGFSLDIYINFLAWLLLNLFVIQGHS